jgi:proteic killer suppression protein
MIVRFCHKGLSELFEVGKTAKIDRQMHSRITRLLDALDRAKVPIDMRVPGFNFHPLEGFKPTRYSVHVNGPWCITFEFEGEHVTQVDFENYH